ncbi:DNA ligase I [Amylocystis lapponica]|nr:DNA ligase I [Amylocystis lapponica]
MFVTVTTRVQIALRPRPTAPTSLVLRPLSTSMGRQQTLGKFFPMPANAKAPPQQSSLVELWGGKKKPQRETPKSEAEPETPNDEVKRDPEEGEGVKRKQSPSNADATDSETERRPKVKKRRVLDSDDEGDAAVDNPAQSKLKSPQPSSPEAPSPGPSSVPAKGKGKGKTVKATTKKLPSRPVAAAKSKGKSKPQTRAAADEEPAQEKTTASDPDEEEDDEEEDPDEELEDEEGVASQNAEAALSRTEEVDIKGGWKVGDPVPYAALAKVFSLIEATTKRLEKTSLLTAFLLLVIQRSAQGDTESLLQAVYLCINRLSPDYVGIELGIGESLLIKAISESTGRSLAVVKADLKKEGDLGLVAMNSKNSQKTLFKPKALTLPFVFAKLKEIALSTGHSSQNKKVSIITKLLAACQGVEAKYIVRSLEGKLRIGNAERTVLVALAHASVLAETEREESASIIKSVYSELPSYDIVVPALLVGGVSKLREKCKLTPGVPLKPMLAKPTKAIGEVLDRFENKRFTCEYKYDGERAQVHRLDNGTVGVFSRNSEDMSKKYPDLMEQLPHCIKDNTRSFVLDAEAVAIDKDSGKLMPFQELSRRKRKDVKVEDIQVRVCLFAFDLLYLNGEPLLQKPLSERRRLLREHFQHVPGEFDFAKSSDGETTDEIQAFLEESVKDGCEGLMVKMLDDDASFYEPSRRSVNWLKLKKDYLAGVGDSLDLVVVGGYYGKGKRTNVYGAFLLACYDADAEEYQTICKIGTGFSEEVLQAHYDTLKPLEMTKVRGDVKVGGAKPDVWFEPRVVWEVLTADLSLSPIYTAAQGLVRMLKAQIGRC